MMVGCWATECKWNTAGWCERGSITIDELKECEDFEEYKDSYKDHFWQACLEGGKPYRRFVDAGMKIEYNGYTFYTTSKITNDESYRLTEERTGVDVGEFRMLKEQNRWKLFVERIGTFPNVSTLPIKEERTVNNNDTM